MGLLYQKRRLKVNKIKRQIASTRRLLQRMRRLVAFFMTISICYFGLWVLKLPQWYIDTNKLQHADPTVLKIQGNTITPNYKIIDMVRQTQLPYTQIFRLNTKQLEENIEQLRPIKKVYVRRYWFPARLIIAVEERTPAFLLSPNLESEPNSALTSDGVIIDHDYLPLHSSIKPIRLLTYGVRNGIDEIWEKKRVQEILKLIRAIEAYSNQEVQYIDLRNEKDVYIMLEEYLVRFGQINETALSRVKWIGSILPEAKKINQKIKYIDLRWEDTKYLRLEGVKEEKPIEKTEQTPKEEKKKINEENTQQETLKNTEIKEEEKEKKVEIEILD